MAFGYDARQPTFTSGEALEADRLVLLSSSTAIYSDGGENPIGLTKEAVSTSTPVAVQVLDGSVQKVTASKAITAGTAIYATTDGKVSDAAVGAQIGIAIEAASAANGKIPALIWQIGRANDTFSGAGRTTNVEFFDDFFIFDGTATVGLWNDAVTDGGTIAAIDAADGHMSIATGATDNDESYISSQFENFLFSTTKNLTFEAMVKLTEANTDDANIIVGLSDTVAADSLLDDGGGPMASYDGCVFFKVDGGVVWQTETSNAGTQVTDTSAGAFTTATWHKLQFVYDFNDGVTASVKFYVDDTLGATSTLTIAGLAEMHVLLGAKAGGANAETLIVDYVQVTTTRVAT
jgi:hypothetical protein